MMDGLKEFILSLLETFLPEAKAKKIKLDVDHQTAEAWPPEWTPGAIKTINQMGVMTTDLGPAEREFILFAAQAKNPLLDIGAAYGLVTRAALMKNARITACDICVRHLDILKESVPEAWHPRLRTTASHFPEALNFKPNSLSGIFAGTLVNYLKPKEIEAGMKKCFDWLEPGGQIFITGLTPFFEFYRVFLPIYKRKLDEGNRWPGQFNPYFLENNITWNQQMSPPYMQIFKLAQAKRLVTDAGFEMIDAHYFAYDYIKRAFPQYNNKECFVVIAKKPPAEIQ